MGKKDSLKEMNDKLPRHEFFQVRALCDEVMSNLCQAKALLEAVNEEHFFERYEVEVLRHYFYAVDTIINGALLAKDELTTVIDHLEKSVQQENDAAESCD